MSSPPISSASSATVTEAGRPNDLESNKPRQGMSYYQRQFDQAGVTEAVLAWNYSGAGTEENPYVVDFLPDDPKNPMAFSQRKKWSITVLQAFAVLAVAFVSTAYTGGISEVLREFGVVQEIGILGISLFVVGFAVGPLIWAPLSELYGRQILFFGTYMALTAFNGGAAGAPNIQSLIVLRFFAGTFGSSPLTNSGGVYVVTYQSKFSLLRMKNNALTYLAQIGSPTCSAPRSEAWRPRFSPRRPS